MKDAGLEQEKRDLLNSIISTLEDLNNAIKGDGWDFVALKAEELAKTAWQLYEYERGKK